LTDMVDTNNHVAGCRE